MYKLATAFLTFILFTAFSGHTIHADEGSQRFFHAGDGTLKIKNPKNGLKGSFRYWQKGKGYDAAVLQKVNQLFGIPAGSPEKMSLRLIAMLDHLQDHFGGGEINLVSGYRSPTYNDNLRKKGKMAAQTSMHTEALAADIDIAGASGKALWEYVRSLDCCGAGYYQGKGIHIDTGDSRFWDQTSSKVGENIAGHNKRLLLKPEWDVYPEGDSIQISLRRITDYPVGIEATALIEEGDKVVGKMVLEKDQKCILLNNASQARQLNFKLPETLDPGTYRIRLKTCEKAFPEMVDSIVSSPIQIKS